MKLPEILEWNEIQKDFTDTLLLGNGASIAFFGEFNYQSLYEYASEKEIITEKVVRLFEYFGSDFEYILKMLMYANAVNNALGNEDETTDSAYAETREALIKTVQNIHPEHKSVEIMLPKAAYFLGKFDTVLNLNYDLLVYWSRLCDHQTNVTFKDCFINGQFDDNWDRFYEPIRGESDVTLVFHPHGSLALTVGLDGIERKIEAAEDTPLLENIIAAWESKKYSPLFVSEGSKEKKTESILGNSYLRTVFSEVLPNVGESLVIYGSNLSDTDDHILEQIRKERRLKRIAVSIWTGNKNYEDDLVRIFTKIKKIFGREIDLHFFDSGNNCWVYSDYEPPKKPLLKFK